MRLNAIGGIVFTTFITSVFAACVWAAFGWPYEARLMPLSVGIPAILLCLAVLAQDAWKLARPGDAGAQKSQIMDIQTDWDLPLRVVVLRSVVMFGWIAVLFVTTWLWGFLISLPLFIFVYLVVQAGEKLWFAATTALLLWGFAVGVFHYLLHVAWLRGYFPTPQARLIEWINWLPQLF